MSDAEIPLFPLSSVLFPGGPLALRIFEPRYLDMVANCLKHDQRFGIVAIRRGSEVGAAETYDTGTLAEIVSWYREPEGFLGLTTIGRGRFRIEQSSRRADGLYVGKVSWLPPEPRIELPERYRETAKVLARLLHSLGELYRNLDGDPGDASWVGYRLAEILPLPVADKQALLEMEDPTARLERLAPMLRGIGNPV
jgi:uncharacterized protein